MTSLPATEDLPLSVWRRYGEALRLSDDNRLEEALEILVGLFADADARVSECARCAASALHRMLDEDAKASEAIAGFVPTTTIGSIMLRLEANFSGAEETRAGEAGAALERDLASLSVDDRAIPEWLEARIRHGIALLELDADSSSPRGRAQLEHARRLDPTYLGAIRTEGLMAVEAGADESAGDAITALLEVSNERPFAAEIAEEIDLALSERRERLARDRDLVSAIGRLISAFSPEFLEEGIEKSLVLLLELRATLDNDVREALDHTLVTLVRRPGRPHDPSQITASQLRKALRRSRRKPGYADGKFALFQQAYGGVLEAIRDYAAAAGLEMSIEDVLGLPASAIRDRVRAIAKAFSADNPDVPSDVVKFLALVAYWYVPPVRKSDRVSDLDRMLVELEALAPEAEEWDVVDRAADEILARLERRGAAARGRAAALASDALARLRAALVGREIYFECEDAAMWTAERSADTERLREAAELATALLAEHAQLGEVAGASRAEERARRERLTAIEDQLAPHLELLRETVRGELGGGAPSARADGI